MSNQVALRRNTLPVYLKATSLGSLGLGNTKLLALSKAQRSGLQC